MNQKELQVKLNSLGANLVIDGQFGPASKTALIKVFTDGPDTKLSKADVAGAATILGVNEAKIWTIWDVEAASSPFIDGRPTILYEPHIFSRLTGHRYDASNPKISSRAWNRKLYPGSQAGRWAQLADAVALDVDAGLQSASFGGFQIVGMNYAVCGFTNPWDFVYAHSQSEDAQLDAFVNFVKGTGNLKKYLQDGNWAGFAKGYNGSAYRENQYDTKLAAAYAKRSR